MARLLIVLAALVVVTVSQNNYCHLKSCNGKIHTMCKFPTPQPARACGRVHQSALSQKEKQEVLNAHNKFRKFVASGQELRGVGGRQPAGIIPPLQWDENLAIIAQRWALQCHWGHDSCRNTVRFQAGQNIAKGSFTGGYRGSLYDRVKRWYDEVAKVNPKNIQSLKFSKETGHYTQLVWGKTTHVGCGVVKYFDGKFYNTVLVCNYGPTGNIRGNRVYQTR